MDRSIEIFFSSLEHGLKAFRQYSQKKLGDEGIDITYDQWLVMQTLNDNRGSNLNQREVAAMVYKDAASITRIIELLLKRGYLEKKVHEDKRRTRLKITESGSEAMKKARHIINECRENALKGIEEKRIKKLRKIITKIAENCE